MQTDAARILAAGVPVTIAGEEHRLIFSMAGLEALEEDFDGLFFFAEALGGGFRKKRLKAIRAGLHAGLLYRSVTRAEVEQMMDSLTGPGWAQVDEVVAAIDSAFEQAIPPAPRQGTGKASSAESGSRGRTSTAPPSTSAAGQESSD